MSLFEPPRASAGTSRLGRWLPIAMFSVCACSASDNGSRASVNGAAGVSALPMANHAGESGSATPTAGGAGAGAATSGGADAASVTAGNAGNMANAAGQAARAAGVGAAGGGGSQAVTVAAGAGGFTGQAGSGGVPSDECGPVPAGRQEPAVPKAVVMHALVEYHTTDANEFVGVHAILTVPAKPPPEGVIFIWPGMQTFPTGPTVQPVGEGVLQPVLTWGQSCVPGALPGHSTWWISPVYVSDGATLPQFSGCHGGPVITVDVGDRLDLTMQLSGTTWNQTVIDLDSKMMTKFGIDLQGQLQQRALFEIELKSETKPTEDIVFDKVVLTMRSPEPGACALNNRGMTDYATNTRVSADGLHCCIDRIVLRADGVPATTMDP